MSTTWRHRAWQWLKSAATPDLPYDYLAPATSPTKITQLLAGTPGIDGNPAQSLLVVLRDGDPSARDAALAGLTLATPRRLASIDEQLRREWLWRAPHLSRQMARRLLDGDRDELALVLAATHPNGYLRQGAVTALGSQPGPAALRLLLLRSADWVGAVRDEARTALERRLADSVPDVIATAAGFAATLADRRQGEWLRRTVEHRLAGAGPELLAALTASPQRSVRRLAYRMGAESGATDAEALLRAALRDPDVLIRAWCAQALVAGGPSPEILAALLRSRTAQVRAAAMAAAIAQNPDAARPALLDRHPLVRSVAQQALRAAGVDPAAVYRRRLDDLTPAVVAGLGETGSRADAEALTGALSAPQPAVRAQAVRALRHLNAAHPARLKPLLGDASPAVVREVVRAVAGHCQSWPRAELEHLLSSEQPRHVRRAGYRLIRATDTWWWLVTALRLVKGNDEQFAAGARMDIHTWLRDKAARTYSRPDPGQAAELRLLLPTLDPAARRALAFMAGLS